MPPSSITPRINRLSATLAGQIAAGEVIERPASIIKELVENSLDAGADRIDIEVEQGGLQSIRVRDNGHGIHADDLPLALESHATSKLRTADDLEAIHSLGFRGEALASIAAVASLELTSCQAGTDQAWTVAVTAGAGVPAPQPAAHPGGTTVTVSTLFQSLPARRKFLRTERTEFLHILETVRRLALSRFATEIRLRHNQRQVLHSRRADDDGERRVGDIMGRAFVRNAARLDSQAGGLRLWGWLGAAEHSRSQSDRQYFFLNGRMIRDRLVTHAVRRALESSVPAGRYPSYVLHLELDPARTDVNVHPTKQEVRFRQARDIHDFIHAAIREAAAVEAPAATGTAAGRAYGAAVGSGSRPVTLADVAGLYRPAPGPESPGTASPAAYAGRLDGYLLVRTGDGLLLLDAGEILRQSTHARLQAGNAVTARPLLVPLVLECREADLQAVQEHREWLQGLGLELELAGPVSLRLRHIPTMLAQADLSALVADLCAALARAPDAGQAACLEVIARHVAEAALQTGEAIDIPDLLQRARELAVDPAGSGLWRYLEAADVAGLLRRGRNGPLP